jgi:hypothetical protein
VRIALIFLVACGGNGGGGGDDDPAPDAATPPAHSGFVSIQSYDAMNIPGMPTRGGYTSAGFFSAGAACTTMQTIGPCEVRQCTTTQPQGAQSAGTITITGALKPLSLVPGADKLYVQQMSMTSLFNGGEMISFAAAGADIPAFTVAVTTPTKATITAPAKPAAASLLAINRAQDFTVSWTGGGSGRLQVFLSGAGGSPSLFCRFAASAGTGKVPAAALATMTGAMGSFAMASINETEKTAGDWGIEASAYFNAVWPDAAIVSGGTTIQ